MVSVDQHPYALCLGSLYHLLQSQQPISADLVPEGWTTDPDEMQEDVFWGAIGEGTLAAVAVGITNPEALMIKSREDGGDGYLFQDANGVYLWNMQQDDVWKYTNPTNLDDILAEMRKPEGTGNVEMTQMQLLS
ncbi:hypothetical protein HYE68_010948 [Fusarium pseudograminearum]|nr:hypothetical protein HYE68_010948 [Fusarium pseudograminearum]